MNATNDTTNSVSAWSHTCQDLISQAAHQYPDKTALKFKDTSFTYSQLIGTANQLAALLPDQGLPERGIVALILDRSPDMVIALLAIMRSGASYLPIDPGYPSDHVEFMLEDAAAHLILTSRRYESRFRGRNGVLYMEDCLEKLPAYPKEDPDTKIEGSTLAYTLYTSGSTGRPKGVQVEHHSLFNLLTSMRVLLGVTPIDRLLAVTTICFDISGLELYLPLIVGAELVLTDSQTAKDARLLLDLLQTEKISIMQATPSTWKLMMDAGWDQPLPLKILCGGEAMTKALAEKLIRLGHKVWNLYGPTETTIWSTIKEINTVDTPITIGWPIANTQVYILDENGRPVSGDKTGEICIAGEGVARGYLNRPELNAERFIADPFAEARGAKMYRTGDLGAWLPNGQIQCFGRIDLQIKIRGFRIEPEEIETLLMKHAAVKDAVVTGKDDQLIAYIITKGPSAADPEISSPFTREIKQWLRSRLPEYMLPEQLVILEQFPLTANGKVDRKALPDPPHMGTGHKGPMPPQTAMERLVAQTWSTCLRQPEVGPDDDYFEMGGNSVTALRIMAYLEKETGKRFPLSILFKAPTIKKLAALFDADPPPASWVPLVEIKAGTNRAPLYLVQGYDMNVLGFNNIAAYMNPDRTIYGFQAKGLNGIDAPHDTIESMAADYVEAMLKGNPHGPYCLAGYSYGGIVAFEMAKQLTVRGKQIGMLAVIDTHITDWRKKEGWGARMIRKALRQFPKLKFVVRNAKNYPRATLRYQYDFFAGKVSAFLAFIRRPAAIRKMTPEEWVDEKYAEAYRKYRPTPYEGCIDLFKVKTRLYFLDDMEFMGWRSFVYKDIAIHEIPGDHKTFLSPPCVKEFADILQKTMDDRLAAI